MGEKTAALNRFSELIHRHSLLSMAESAASQGSDACWSAFDALLQQKDAFQDDEERHIVVDLFFAQCLETFQRNNNSLFAILEKWLPCRNLENRCGNLQEDEKVALIHFCIKLREKLREFLRNASDNEIHGLTETQQHLVIAVWRQVFFEPFSALSLYWRSSQREKAAFLDECRQNGYNGLMVASMFQPFAADEYNIDAEALISSSLPYWYKAILSFWLVNTPYFHGEERHRQKLIRYVPALCTAIMKHPGILSTAFFFTFVQEVMTGLWRASYFGGNNVIPLSAFGDFITFVMYRTFPYKRPQPDTEKLQAGKRLRIGYLSRNFYKQAVSCYMVNRVIHHDQDKFEVYIYALGDYHDEISELFKQHCDHFERFTNLTDLKRISETILNQKLDMLIYTDIGMDPTTYMLSGLQLAPVQCAMVGHGTSTGMPNIQYYLSGDFESPKAQDHYRERLIRLPKLGAAQYMPMIPEQMISRQELGIPEEAVVFISCANGLKHGAQRDMLLIEILKKAPNAWILLKPYAHHASMDLTFAQRLLNAAKKAGVRERFIILPPVGQAKHVMGLLGIADVQLDTYPYGGWTTNLEALYMGLPLVTQEGELARSRWGAGMLKALGIKEGIAQNETEYVKWAVRLAKDTTLLKKLKTRIKKKAVEVLFNGSEAQPSFEECLLALYQERCREAVEHPMTTVHEKITLATSLSPDNIPAQQRAIATWLQAGFNLVSVNSLEQIALLKPYFSNVEFAASLHEGKQDSRQNYTALDDLFTYFRQRSSLLCGIISPDIHLHYEGLPSFIAKQAPDSLVYGSVLEVDAAMQRAGQCYEHGFDYFFFDKKILEYYPRQEFCLGLPWWDYWVVLVPLMRKLPVKKLAVPAAWRIKRSNTWGQNTWLSLGRALSGHFHPPFTLSDETMQRFAGETLKIINTLSEPVVYREE